MKTAYIIMLALLINQDIYSQENPQTNTQQDSIYKAKSNKFYDTPAEYPGGKEAFIKELLHELMIPETDQSINKVLMMVRFNIETDSSSTEIKILRDPGLGVGFNRKVVTKIQSMPKWKPAIKDGENVRSEITIPITIITLNKEITQ